jgi:hypothetical protein
MDIERGLERRDVGIADESPIEQLSQARPGVDDS